MTDPELIARVLVDHEPAAFGELVRQHQSAVRHFLRHLTRGDAALADDLAQETFLSAYRSLSRFHNRSGFSTWLLGIAHNQWRNARRRAQAIPLEPSHLEAIDPVPAATTLSDLQQDLSRALAALNPEERHVFHLAYQQGLSHAEIADVLDCPVGTVKTHLNRGKEKLRPLLASWNPQT